MDEVAMIAVVNNPGLKAMRDQVGVAEAQAFAPDYCQPAVFIRLWRPDQWSGGDHQFGKRDARGGHRATSNAISAPTRDFGE